MITHTFTNTNDGIESTVDARGHDYFVRLFDLDAGEFVQIFTSCPTEELAISKAKAMAFGAVA